jgi:hypothetical protein
VALAGLAFWLWMAASPGLASPDEIAATLEQLPNADLVLMNDPAAARPVRVLLATRVSAPLEKLRQVLADVGSYRKAMPSFRRTDVLSTIRAAGATEVEVAWELEVPIWNLTGKLWLYPRAQGVDLELREGDFSPGLFHLKALPTRTGVPASSLLVIDGYANLRESHWAIRKLVHRSPLVEPVMTVAAVYVMLRALADLTEHAVHARPTAPVAAPDLSALDGTDTGRAANAFAVQPKVLAVVHRRLDGRLARVEVALPLATAPEDASGKSLHPEAFRDVPGWKRVAVSSSQLDECKDAKAACWAIESNLPFFSTGGIFKVFRQPWRARMLEGDSKGAVLGLDFVPAQNKSRATLVVSQHPRIDRAGYVPRKLIAAEPLLEHGLSLALTIVEAVALAPALEGP